MKLHRQIDERIMKINNNAVGSISSVTCCHIYTSCTMALRMCVASLVVNNCT